MDLEVGIINWLFYFLLDNKSLSVYSQTSSKQNLTLTYKAKLHLPIIDTTSNSKKLNSIIAQALDEISEELSLTNNRCSIIIDDSLLFHSIIIRSKKFKNINEQIKNESELKWGKKIKNLYFISEERKTPKNIFHSVAIHHFLREKIKLNFNNFGLSIKYIIPMSSILTSGLKSTQFAVLKNGNKFQFFGNTRKGFMLFSAIFSGQKKTVEKRIGLLDLPTIKKSDLEKQGLKFIHFNRIKIVEYLANYIFNNVPLLNFNDSNKAQILSGDLESNDSQYFPSPQRLNHNKFIKNLSSAILSLLFLAIVLSFFSNYDFLNIDQNQATIDKKNKVNNISEEVFLINPSDYMIANLLNIKEKFSDIDTFYILENSFIVNGESIDINKDGVSYSNKTKINFNDLLIRLFEIENDLKFKVFSDESKDPPSQNIVLRFENIENSFIALSEINKYSNISLIKATFDKSKNSLYFYLTILK